MYFVKGGNSKWMATLVQLAGFPILIPYYFIIKLKNPTAYDTCTKPPSVLTLTAIYVSLGLLMAADCFMYSIGLQYLPVSTYTLICASQLAFNSVFSFFLNSQKFTPFIINSLVLLTISSVLLVFNNESANPTRFSKAKYAIGFICTVAASAGSGLMLSLTQLCFRKVLKRQTFKVVMDMVIYQGIVATGVTMIGFFAGGEWKIVAVFLFHDKMDGIKAISMLLAVWGFLSYVYQHYLDDRKSKAENRNAIEVSKASNTGTSREE
ncbi:hypothetical protein GH714_043112 [Hevea brasiliensis]|uniref:Purine permease n=1 Tax=Hevea brasiliensis TaxID=3981 RepID=A0A6A6K1W4_HEVBR|nr:hypothetical protein GH714_043112 [Hevea brasiliensis]